MDDQTNQGMPVSVPQQPTEPIGGIGSMGMGMTPPPASGAGMSQEDPHEKIIAALTRIEEKLALIAAKVGA
ncbi:MAG: hypothetical protein AAB600_05485 [Patescibacteria group bacterium]